MKQLIIRLLSFIH